MTDELKAMAEETGSPAVIVSPMPAAVQGLNLSIDPIDESSTYQVLSTFANRLATERDAEDRDEMQARKDTHVNRRGMSLNKTRRQERKLRQ